jgi:hypothetical protein
MPRCVGKHHAATSQVSQGSRVLRVCVAPPARGMCGGKLDRCACSGVSHSGTLWAAVLRRDQRLMGHPFVLVLIPAFLAGLARRDVSLDGRSAAISRPIASPHGRAR